MNWKHLKFRPQRAKRWGASSRRKRTPRWTFCPPSGERSKLYQSQRSGFTRAKRAGSTSA